MNSQTSSTVATSPGAIPPTPRHIAAWVAGGLGLIGAGALGAMLVTTGMKTEPAALIEPPSHSSTLVSVPKAESLSVNESVVPPTLVPDQKAKPPIEKNPVPAKSVAVAQNTPKIAAKPVCDHCGTIESVTAVRQKGAGTGLGVVAGGVLGGVVGHQLGGGSGKQALTLLGAVGGGFAGNEVEKQARSVIVYKVHVHMDNGSTRILTQSAAPMVGARVRIDGNHLRNLAVHNG